ncbi:Diaminopimelate epimerase-like protein [Coccomyxa subellipsoidea C-169]|uniref:Diaminopimelate epimerase-like protein n=1 Tax=Coccomyxa subellipsoidea (strain C-169) TaxID=574566 RepID=I0Z2D4_COCSC|nr:Diaminopimelate epimerase-like protein [Coccomyxa subellipsoidea C-169]EIE24803.1 Diaminopimelate epimerase-like protein [Coccomyxa subellipsoidea C-169]|eukprot:XP_005649347.1 Diaminopimelate epimerase-like protein [Coccomyxa subellipsoidea C-169]
MASSIPLYQVDAFSQDRFHGNSAAVCILTDPSNAFVDDATMAKIANEMNLSETAFLEPSVSGEKGRFKLRWFTPSVEVDLCGHATVATAAALIQGEGLQADVLQFETRSGTLTVRHREDGQYHLSVPSYPPADDFPGSPEHRIAILQAVFGAGNVDMAASLHYSSKLRYLMAVCRDGTTREQLQSLAPDFRSLKEACQGSGVFAIMVTAADPSGEHDLLLRFFAPMAGIDEDPVTGSAYAVAGPFWAQRLNRRRLCARQCSPRGGDITVTPEAEPGRVDVAGAAVIVSKGVLYLD